MNSIRWVTLSISTAACTLVFAASLSAGAVLSLLPGTARADQLPCYSEVPNTTCLTFVNKSSAELNMTVDGNYACYLNPGESCSYNAAVGPHHLAAQAGSGGPLMVDQKGYLGKGPASWTLSGTQQNGVFGNLQGDWTGLQPEDYANNASSNSAPIPKGSYIASGITCDGNPCSSSTTFQPGSSAELFGTVIKPKGAPTGSEPKCTIIWSQLTGNEVTGTNSEVIHPGRVIGNHVVFGPDTGNFGVGGHCLEDPNVTTTQGSSLYFNSSNAPEAKTTATKFAESVGTVPPAMPQTAPPQTSSPEYNQSSGGSDDDNWLLIGAGVGLGAALLVGSSSKSGGSCPSGSYVCLGYNSVCCPNGTAAYCPSTNKCVNYSINGNPCGDNSPAYGC